MGWKAGIVNVSVEFEQEETEGTERQAPTARPHTSPGQRPGKRMEKQPEGGRAGPPTHFIW